MSIKRIAFLTAASTLAISTAHAECDASMINPAQVADYLMCVNDTMNEMSATIDALAFENSALRADLDEVTDRIEVAEIDMIVEADLTPTYLMEIGAMTTNFAGDNFSLMDLGYADFSGATLQRADFSDATLTWASLRAAQAPLADFSGASLSVADLSYGDFRSANFSYSGLYAGIIYDPESDLDATPTRMTGGNFTDANFSGASIGGVDFTDADLTGADFTETSWVSRDTVIWSNTICPDGTNSDDNGDSCFGNL